MYAIINTEIEKRSEQKMMIDLIIPCVFCHNDHIVSVKKEDYWAWQNGKHAQDAFPYLSVNDREMLISGICPTCWNKMFGGEN